VAVHCYDDISISIVVAVTAITIQQTFQQTGLEKPVFKKKPNPVGFGGFIGFFWTSRKK